MGAVARHECLYLSVMIGTEDIAMGFIKNTEGEAMITANTAFKTLGYCAVILGSAASAVAGPPPPQLYGAYTVNGAVFCQPGSFAGAGGAYDVNVGLAKFNPNNGANAGIVVLQQTQVYGSAISGTLPFAVVTKSYDYDFSNTSTTITLNNVPYTAIYSNIKSGIAGAVSGVGVDSNGCARNFTMQLTTVPPPPA